MRKVFSTILILSLLLSLSLISAITVMADGTTWYVNASYTGAEEGTETNPYNTIQEAINAALDGDTINVAAGTYDEQLLIQESLTIIGAGEATTIIQAPATRAASIEQTPYTYDYIIAAYPASGTIDVRIEGFTIDANNQAETTGTNYLVGVFFRDVSGTSAGLFSCTIQGFQPTEYKSYGIKVDGNSMLTIDHNTISDYTRDGMEIRGSGLGNPAVTISNNDLTGSELPLQGISLIDGATGSITGNTVSGHTRSAEWAACGILVDNSDGISVTGNTVLNTFYAIYIGDADNCTVSGNILTDYIKRAISLDAANNNTISNNTITGHASGTDDVGIGLTNNSSNNTIGGDTAPAGNTITMATPSVPDGTPLMYAIHLDGTAGSGNTIKFNTITGGKRAVQIDGPPGITGTTTISNNTISGQAWGGITAYNNGNLVITNNTLTDTVRPI
jgi:parallel beta-helix repeat protein